MKFPVALEAYVLIEENDELNKENFITRKVVYNEIEVNAFTQRFDAKKYQIVTRPLNAEELADPRTDE